MKFNKKLYLSEESTQMEHGRQPSELEASSHPPAEETATESGDDSRTSPSRDALPPPPGIAVNDKTPRSLDDRPSKTDSGAESLTSASSPDAGADSGRAAASEVKRPSKSGLKLPKEWLKL